MSEPEIIVEHRADLTYLLTEAAEIEHGLMCCYLYAAFSLRESSEGLSPAEAAAVARFRSTILDVARDEMVHLALVSNLLSALGSAPHWQRQNFPVSPGYHPAGVVVSLAPFDRATLDHFLFLERPEGVSLPDGAGFAPSATYARGRARGRLVPSAQDYETVGHLYRGIRDGFVAMTERWGSAKVFCGDPRAQVGPEIMSMRGMSAVFDLPSALAAIDTIVTQGEGAPGHSEGSHYRRFLALQDELAALQAENPGFEPARAAARNPVMRRPPTPEGRVWIARAPAAELLDLGNATYSLMLRGLAALFSPIDDPEVRGAVADLAVSAMKALTPIATYLPRLPATEDDAGPRAGLTFSTTRSPLTFAGGARGLRLLAEGARSIARGHDEVAVPLDPRFQAGRDAMAKLALSLEALADRPPAAASPAVAAPSPAAAPPPAPTPGDRPGVEIIRGEHIEIAFEARRCIHARHCVLETPEVFLANVQGPWIHPDNAPIDRLVHVARSCPSGAITYARLDGGAPEDAPPVNLVRVRERGPLAVLADLHLDGQPPCHRATLCRCGASRNKPFCDGSHAAIGFDATGEPATVATDPLAVRGGPLQVSLLQNGPLRVRGPLELLSGTGRTIRRLTEAKLCRCGGSANKPYCDGTHARIGFEAEGHDA
jgi:CDGSH-type Zn-finger protein/uncharacterized Fe-S cluster protein YjdI